MKLVVSQFGQNIFEIEIPDDDLLGGNDIYLGRAQECQIVLEDQQVSRHHAVLSYKNNQIYIKRQSTFGVLSVNGNEIVETSLNLGDRIGITSYVLQVISLPKSTVPAPAPQPEEDSNELEDDLYLEDDRTQILDEIENTEILSDDETTILEEEVENTGLDNTGFENHLTDDDHSFANDEGFLDDEQEAVSTLNESEEEPVSFEEENSSFQEEGFGSESDSFGESEYGDDEGFGDSGGGDSTQVFQSFANYYLRIKGPFAPFDRYTIEAGENKIGRDPAKCQIVLSDSEVSGVHAIIRKTLINCFLEDQNSSNGTILNGERINKAELVNGDEFTIGQTQFVVEISSDILDAEQDILMPVEENQMVEVEEIVEEEVDFDEMTGEGDEFGVSTEVQEKSILKRIWKDPQKRKKLIYGLLGVAVLLAITYDPEAEKKKTAKSKTAQSKVAKPKAGDATKEQIPGDQAIAKKDLSPEVLEKLEQNYALALAKYEAGEYYEAKEYLEIIRGIDANYKDTQTLLQLVKQGHEELLRLKREEEAEKERKLRQLKVEQLVGKAKEAVKAREVTVAENLFGQIMQIDPENIDVPQLKMEIDAYKKAIEDKRLEEERVKAARKAMVDALAPGKSLYLKEEWFTAIDRLEKFLGLKGMDEDLVKEATEMLKTSQRKLSAMINPLLGKARSFKEGQDLKRAYETYGEVLRVDPTNEEALSERDAIMQTLTARSRRLYREALISESLSLFEEAKERFQQVQQISPINSEYYLKASEKLKNYLE
jgi:pSer/pThr/pTyr-binding forkhead associated (FHA) protein